jgi:hypothetical protein
MFRQKIQHFDHERVSQMGFELVAPLQSSSYHELRLTALMYNRFQKELSMPEVPVSFHCMSVALVTAPAPVG